MEEVKVALIQTCCVCNIAKESCEFRKCKTSSGKEYIEKKCKKCINEKRTLTIGSKSKEKIASTAKQLKDKKYYLENKERIKARNNKYYAEKKATIRAQRKEYYKLHPEKLKEQREKFLSKIENRIALNLRRRTRTFLHSGKGWSDLLGCDIEHFISWLEFNFEKEETDMSLENYGKVWQLDHVYPLSKFDMKNEEDVKKAFNWQNILPAICIDNQTKNNKIFKENLTTLENRLKEFKVLNSS